MTRVSENSQHASMQFALNKAKNRLENLQLKGATLRSMTKPSDNPVSNVESMQLTSSMNDNKQYVRNGNFALMHLNVTEKSLDELTNILTKAKELAIAQSSDFYNEDVRKNVSKEVSQLRNLALSIANKRIGQKYIFSGFKTLKQPFDSSGNYHGDKGNITLEVAKDFFVPVNIDGHSVFFSETKTSSFEESPLKSFPQMNKTRPDGEQFEETEIEPSRDLASVDEANPANQGYEKRENIFALLDNLVSGLENNEPKVVQGLLEKFDTAISRLITLRTKVGSITNSVETTMSNVESENIDQAARKSSLVDADIAEIFSDLTRQQEVLKTTYKSTQGMLNQTLLDFLR